MDLLRSLPRWREHAMEVIGASRRKKGPRPHMTRVRAKERREEELIRRSEQKRADEAAEERRMGGAVPSAELLGHAEAVLSKPLVDEERCSLVLQQVANERALQLGRRLHAHLAALSYDGDVFLGNHLVRMYAKCGRLDLAYDAFDRIRRRNTFSWNILIRAYIDQGKHLESAKLMFDHIPKPSFASWNTMIQAYAQLGQLETAEYMFWRMKKKTTVTYTIMMRAYSAVGNVSAALLVFKLMDMDGVGMDKMAISCILDVCAAAEELQEGEAIVRSVVDIHLLIGPLARRALIGLYGSCKQLSRALDVFLSSPDREAALWGALIEAYAVAGQVRVRGAGSGSDAGRDGLPAAGRVLLEQLHTGMRAERAQ